MNRTVLWIVVGLVVLVAILGFARKSGYVPSLSPSPTPTPSASVSPSPGAVKPKATTPTSTKTYSQLVQEYAGRRIQFDQFCQASPNSTTFKNGTSVMFDNRSGDPRTITVDGKAYQLVGYGYRILALSSPTLPKTMILNCGAAVNVGKILLQN